MTHCVDSSELVLLQTALFLGEEMLAHHAVTFPKIYQRYVSLLNRDSQDTVQSPKYKVLLFLGKEFGDLMSSSCPCPRIGRLLYQAKCDPYVMLSHALGATKNISTQGTGGTGGTGSKALPIQQVAPYLNERVHDLSSNIIAKYDEAPSESWFEIGFFFLERVGLSWRNLLVVFPLICGK